MIFGGVNNSGSLDSVEMFNLHTKQSSSFGILKSPVTVHVGGIFDGIPFYCGGGLSLASAVDSCYKFDQSWKKVIILYFL